MENPTTWGLSITFASFSPSSVFTTLSAAMSDCKTGVGNKNKSSWWRWKVTDSTMPLATVMHHHVSLHILLFGSTPTSWRARAPSDWRDVRHSASSRRAALPQTYAASPAVLTANDLSCCSVTPTTLEKGWILSEPPEGAFRYICNDCWLQWDMKISLFINICIVEKMFFVHVALFWMCPSITEGDG